MFFTLQSRKAAALFKDAEDPTFSGKAVAWLAAGIITVDLFNPLIPDINIEIFQTDHHAFP